MMHPSLLLAVSALTLSIITVQTVQSLRIYDICDSPTVRVNPFTSPFNIRSPNYGIRNYRDNLTCSLVLESGFESLVLIFFYRDFNLEPELKCEYDSLCVNGALYCNDWETGLAFAHILPSNSRSTIIFKTDYSVERSGFEITVIPQPIVYNQTITEATGVGPTDRHINFKPVRYHPGMPYTDACSDLPAIQSKHSGLAATELQPGTEPPATQGPATPEPPATQGPATTEPPTTQGPAITEPPTTQGPATT